ncbi:MAG: hypothetical protein EZS28_032078, partial [Streblomastix strix]
STIARDVSPNFDSSDIEEFNTQSFDIYSPTFDLNITADKDFEKNPQQQIVLSKLSSLFSPNVLATMHNLLFVHQRRFYVNQNLLGQPIFISGAMVFATSKTQHYFRFYRKLMKVNAYCLIVTLKLVSFALHTAKVSAIAVSGTSQDY